MSAFEMYLIMQVDSLLGAIWFALVVSGIAILLIIVITLFSALVDLHVEGDANLEAKLKGPVFKAINIPGAVFALALLLVIVIPSAKTLLVAYGVSSVTQIEGVEKLPEKSVQALEKMLSDYLAEKD